jgi:hypothetical protein
MCKRQNKRIYRYINAKRTLIHECKFQYMCILYNKTNSDKKLKRKFCIKNQIWNKNKNCMQTLIIKFQTKAVKMKRKKIG